MLSLPTIFVNSGGSWGFLGVVPNSTSWQTPSNGHSTVLPLQPPVSASTSPQKRYSLHNSSSLLGPTSTPSSQWARVAQIHPIVVNHHPSEDHLSGRIFLLLDSGASRHMTGGMIFFLIFHLLNLFLLLYRMVLLLGLILKDVYLWVLLLLGPMFHMYQI